MRILITTEFYLPFQCGVTTAVLNERKCLEAEGHEVRILTIYEGKVSKYKDGVYYIKSTIPQLYKDSYATLNFHDPLLKDIYEWHPDVVHSQCEFFTMAYAKKVVRKLHIPLVHTCHTDFSSYGVHFTKSDRLWQWATSTFVPKFMKAADFVICPTNKIYDLLKSYEVKNPMEIIPCGLDLSHLDGKLPDDERDELRASFGFSKSDVVLVSVCRLSEEKNVSETVEHFHALSKFRDDARLLIVGDGTERETLEKQVKDLDLEDIVRFAGNIAMDDVWKYYKCGDFFVSSSKSEIQGLTYIEALACGLPILCRQDPALDMSLIKGVNGFDFIDEDSFHESAIRLIDDKELRIQMGVAAKESVDKFSLPNFASNLESVFGQVIADNKYSASM